MSVHTYTCRLATHPPGETSRIEAADPNDAAIDFVSDGCFSFRELDDGLVVAVDDGERIDAYLVRQRLVATRINRPAEGAVQITLTAADRDVAVHAPEAENCPAKRVQDGGKLWWMRSAAWHHSVRSGRGMADTAKDAATSFARSFAGLDRRDLVVNPAAFDVLVCGADEPPALTSGLWQKFTLAFFPGASDWEVLVDHDAQDEVPR